jgi:hypothetical protein
MPRALKPLTPLGLVPSTPMPLVFVVMTAFGLATEPLKIKSCFAIRKLVLCLRIVVLL